MAGADTDMNWQEKLELETEIEELRAELAQHRLDLKNARRAVAGYLATPRRFRDDADLADIVVDYEPSEAEQGLIPIPQGYKEP